MDIIEPKSIILGSNYELIMILEGFISLWQMFK